MAPGLVLGTAAVGWPNYGRTDEEWEAFLTSTNSVKYIGVIYDFGISLQIKRIVFDVYLGAGYVYQTGKVRYNQAGFLATDSLLLRWGIRMGFTI